MSELEEELMFEYDSDDEKEKIQKEKEEAERARLACSQLYDEDEIDNGVKEVTEDLVQENNGEVVDIKSQQTAIDSGGGNIQPQQPPTAGSVFSRLGPRDTPLDQQNFQQEEIEDKQVCEEYQQHKGNESFGGGDEENSPAVMDEEEEKEDDDDEEEDDDDSRRSRFKSERTTISRSISLTTDKPKWNIPDSLDDVITPQLNMDQMRPRHPRHNRGNPYQRGGWENPYQRSWENPYQRGMESPYQRGMESPYQRGMEGPYQRGLEDPYQRNWDARSARFGMYGPNNGIRSLMDNTGIEEQQLPNQNSFILSPHSPQLRPIQQVQPQPSKLSSIKSRLSIPNSQLKGLQTKTGITPVAATQPGKTTTKDKQQKTTVIPTGKVITPVAPTGNVTTPAEVQTTPLAVKRPHANNVSDNTASAKQIKLEIPSGKNPISLLYETFKGGTVKFLEKQIGTVPHNPEFECNVEIKGDSYYGVGKSKKVARLKAAEIAVIALMQAGVIPMDESQIVALQEDSSPPHTEGISPAGAPTATTLNTHDTEHGIPPEQDISTVGAQTTTSLNTPQAQVETLKSPHTEVQTSLGKGIPQSSVTSHAETQSTTLPETQQSQLNTPHADNVTPTTDSPQQIELEIPIGKNAISILHEMLGNKIRFIDQNLGLVHAPEFECSVTLDGQTFIGVGKQKKVAKKKAAEATLLGLMQNWINGKFANISMAGTQTMNQLIDAHYRRQQQNGTTQQQTSALSGPQQTDTSIIK